MSSIKAESAKPHGIKQMRAYRAPDGALWGVDVQLPGPSNAMIVFHNSDRRTAREDRYAWIDWHGPSASNVTAHITAAQVRDALTDEQVARLFRRSMPLDSGRGPAMAPA